MWSVAYLHGVIVFQLQRSTFSIKFIIAVFCVCFLSYPGYHFLWVLHVCLHMRLPVCACVCVLECAALQVESIYRDARSKHIPASTYLGAKADLDLNLIELVKAQAEAQNQAQNPTVGSTSGDGDDAVAATSPEPAASKSTSGSRDKGDDAAEVSDGVVVEHGDAPSELAPLSPPGPDASVPPTPYSTPAPASLSRQYSDDVNSDSPTSAPAPAVESVPEGEEGEEEQEVSPAPSPSKMKSASPEAAASPAAASPAAASPAAASPAAASPAAASPARAPAVEEEQEEDVDLDDLGDLGDAAEGDKDILEDDGDEAFDDEDW